MPFIGILLATGTIGTLVYAGYVLSKERRIPRPSSNMPFLPRMAEADVEEAKETNSQNRIFEAYVADKFDREEYRLVHWRREKKGKDQQASVPALSFHLANNGSLQFSVECLYTPAFTNTNAIGISPAEIERYYAYQDENNRAVFVIFGVGGTPEKPNRLHVVPLIDIPREQDFLPASYLSRYRKLDMKSNFFLLPERMLLI